MTNHLASLHMNLSPEGWSRTSHVEAAIENELSSEENARRRAVDARKEAERLRLEYQRKALEGWGSIKQASDKPNAAA